MSSQLMCTKVSGGQRWSAVVFEVRVVNFTGTYEYCAPRAPQKCMQLQIGFEVQLLEYELAHT